jgi:hypothetical protein
MLRMLQAHGLDAGPTQRPSLAGAAAGLIAALPALGIMLLFGSLDAPARATGTSPIMAAFFFSSALLVGGLLYGCSSGPPTTYGAAGSLVCRSGSYSGCSAPYQCCNGCPTNRPYRDILPQGCCWRSSYGSWPSASHFPSFSGGSKLG